MYGIAKRALLKIGLLDWGKALRDQWKNQWNAITFTARYRISAMRCNVNNVSNGLPIPPAELTFLVSGQHDVFRSLKGGIAASENNRYVLRKNGLSIEDFGCILDFGCGWGRVLRNWKSLGENRLHATDYNATMVSWCKKNLPFAHYKVNELEPLLEYEDCTFDLIWSLSVFTHVNEELQHAWMAELRRVLKDGAYLIFTTHGSRYINMRSAAEREQFEHGRLVVLKPDESGKNICSAYHPESYVRNKLVTEFEVLDFIAEGATGHGGQDLWLLRKPSITGPP